jgi:hypothetical protein
MALGIPSVFAFLPREINKPCNKRPIKTAIAPISLDIAYVGRDTILLHSILHIVHKITCSQDSMTV